MMKFIIACIAIISISTMVTDQAESRSRHASYVPEECNITMPCDFGQTRSKKRSDLREPASEPLTRRAAATKDYSAGIVAPLAEKLASIQAACPGTHAISGVRHTRIAGTRRMSLHAQGKAVDVRGPYSCIYAQLRDWTGGYSTDAGRVKHIHISYDEHGGREMGLRFAHGSRRAAWRTASYYRR